ncbi:MAG: DUF1549 domain-containing protein [Acidobacteria bacterium]|nr:DUF1549 domain-containing protein [Acidobacteriota bacterium]
MLNVPADPRMMIRRASMLLTGLAPTPERVEKHLVAAKANPDAAYAALIDKLLPLVENNRENQ